MFEYDLLPDRRVRVLCDEPEALEALRAASDVVTEAADEDFTDGATFFFSRTVDRDIFLRTLDECGAV